MSRRITPPAVVRPRLLAALTILIVLCSAIGPFLTWSAVPASEAHAFTDNHMNQQLGTGWVLLVVPLAVMLLTMFLCFAGLRMTAMITGTVGLVAMMFVVEQTTTGAVCWDGVDDQGRPVGSCFRMVPGAGSWLALGAAVLAWVMPMVALSAAPRQKQHQGNESPISVEGRD